MADMDRDSDTEDDYEDDDDVGDSCDDSDYDYTGEESNLEEAERCGFDWQDEEVETFSNGEGKARDYLSGHTMSSLQTVFAVLTGSTVSGTSLAGRCCSPGGWPGRPRCTPRSGGRPSSTSSSSSPPSSPQHSQPSTRYSVKLVSIKNSGIKM